PDRARARRRRRRGRGGLRRHPLHRGWSRGTADRLPAQRPVPDARAAARAVPARGRSAAPARGARGRRGARERPPRHAVRRSDLGVRAPPQGDRRGCDRAAAGRRGDGLARTAGGALHPQHRRGRRGVAARPRLRPPVAHRDAAAVHGVGGVRARRGVRLGARAGRRADRRHRHDRGVLPVPTDRTRAPERGPAARRPRSKRVVHAAAHLRGVPARAGRLHPRRDHAGPRHLGPVPAAAVARTRMARGERRARGGRGRSRDRARPAAAGRHRRLRGRL
ncbi:MAG: hypothetical protein AVDCRST_MAG85-99, partial [uncultured Solirubrobacteraceae bacterium]